VVLHRLLQLAAQVRHALLARPVADAVSTSSRARSCTPAGRSAVALAGGELGGLDAGAAAEHDQVAERVGAEAVGAVEAGAGDLAGGVEAGTTVFWPSEITSVSIVVGMPPIA
jgi:hypothetical protein